MLPADSPARGSSRAFWRGALAARRRAWVGGRARGAPCSVSSVGSMARPVAGGLRRTSRTDLEAGARRRAAGQLGRCRSRLRAQGDWQDWLGGAGWAVVAVARLRSAFRDVVQELREEGREGERGERRAFQRWRGAGPRVGKNVPAQSLLGDSCGKERPRPVAPTPSQGNPGGENKAGRALICAGLC